MEKIINKLTVCVDFDGVLNDYHGYDENDLSIPRVGAREFLLELQKDYKIVIHTTRDSNKVKDWLNEYNFPCVEVTNVKQPAIVYIDDRGVLFDGDYNKALNNVKNFKTYWE